MITEGFLARHYRGAGAKGPAIIDIAQDHLLWHLTERGVLDLGVVLKGGTAIRKLRAGNAGRFSTDLDFAGLTDDYADLLLEEIDGVTIGQFRFSVRPINGTIRAALDVESPFGPQEVQALLDLGRRSVWLPPEVLPILPLPIHRAYGFELPAVRTSRLEEVIAEKLARFRRRSMARDLYDLAWLATRPFDESLVRRVTVLKVWSDVNNDRLGAGPFSAEDVLAPKRADDFESEAIGYLTAPVDFDRWIGLVDSRFGFLRDMDTFELEVASCNVGDRWKVTQAIDALKTT